MMMVLVAYDVNTETPAGQSRLRHVAKVCDNRGQRVQNSVFECLVDPSQWVELKRRLVDSVNLERDSLRFYYLGKHWQRRVEHFGAKPGYDPQGPLLV
jgi:CRISPR-associated protein Cas2